MGDIPVITYLHVYMPTHWSDLHMYSLDVFHVLDLILLVLVLSFAGTGYKE